jgi:LmbE family N-acetylglucosaminyl deacetylase
VLSPAPPVPFEPRGTATSTSGTPSPEQPDGPDDLATTRIDVSPYVDQKVAAIAAQRTQFPIRPDLFPRSMLQEMLGREYFVRIRPRRELDTEL